MFQSSQNHNIREQLFRCMGYIHNNSKRGVKIHEPKSITTITLSLYWRPRNHVYACMYNREAWNFSLYVIYPDSGFLKENDFSFLFWQGGFQIRLFPPLNSISGGAALPQEALNPSLSYFLNSKSHTQSTSVEALYLEFSIFAIFWSCLLSGTSFTISLRPLLRQFLLRDLVIILTPLCISHQMDAPSEAMQCILIRSTKNL